MDAVAEHVVVVAHDDAVVGVFDLALISFDVQGYAGGIFPNRTAGILAVVGNRQHGPTQRVEPGHGGCGCVGGGFVGGGLFIWTLLPVASLVVPGGQVVSSGEKPKKLADIGVGLGVGPGHRVVHVPHFLPPGIKHDFLISVVGVECGHHAFHGVVEQDWRYAGIGHLRFGFIQMRAAEEGFVLFDRLAFVVVQGAALAHPAGARGAQHGNAVVERQCAGADIAASQKYVCRTGRCITRLGLNF